MDHLGIDHTLAQHAIITGSPERVPDIVKCLGGGRELTNRRGLLCWESSCGEQATLVVATGIGAPATAIVVEELAELGVHTIIRLGTCGALQKDIDPGSLVVPTGCVREEGTTQQYIDLSFPAVPDFQLTNILMNELSNNDRSFYFGVIHCKDSYYLEKPGKQLLPEVTGMHWEALRRAGVVATEMESSVLFILGTLRNLRTATVLISVGEVTDPMIFAKALDSAVSAIGFALKPLGPSPQWKPETCKKASVANSYLGNLPETKKYL